MDSWGKGQRMGGAIPPFPNMPPWRGAQLKKAQGVNIPLTAAKDQREKGKKNKERRISIPQPGYEHMCFNDIKFGTGILCFSREEKWPPEHSIDILFCEHYYPSRLWVEQKVLNCFSTTVPRRHVGGRQHECGTRPAQRLAFESYQFRVQK
jgi:hypothetical protein